MNYQWHFDRYRPPPGFQEMIEPYIHELEGHVRLHAPDAISLQGSLARRENKKLLELTLVLKLPGSTLNATEKGRAVGPLLRHGFDALIQKVRQDRGENRKHEAKSGQSPVEEKAVSEAEMEIVEPYVPRLAQYVQREITYFVATGELEPESVRVEDVVDETVMRALSEKPGRPVELGIDRWLITLAADVLARQVQQAEVFRQTSGGGQDRVEQRVSRVPPERVGAAVEDEIYQWYQPDEKLHLEDILADPHTQSPEEIAASEQLLDDLDRTIAFLPKRWRDVFVLHSMEGFTLMEIAIVTGQPVDQVQLDLDAAQEFLRERLTPMRVGAPSAARRAPVE